MCDYSIKVEKTRKARVGDVLVVTNFGTGTRGFARPEDGNQVATCVLPGTELAFEKPILSVIEEIWQKNPTGAKTAIFRQTNKEFERMHHDVIERPDGERILLTDLAEGQKATVLQLPHKPKNEAEAEDQRRAEYAG